MRFMLSIAIALLFSLTAVGEDFLQTSTQSTQPLGPLTPWGPNLSYGDLTTAAPAASPAIANEWLNRSIYSAPGKSLSESFIDRISQYSSGIEKEAKNATEQLMKALPDLEKRTSNAIAAERAKLEKLERDMPLNADPSQISVTSASSIAWIEAQAVNIQRMADRSEAFLGLDQVRRQLAPESETFLREQLASGREMIKFARERSNPTISQLAYDVVQPVYKFTSALAGGFVSGFYDLGQTIAAVYEQPGILKKIAGDLIETVKHPGQALVALEGALIGFAVTMAYGTAEERGHALGKFAADFVIGVASDGISSAALGTVKTAFRGLISEPVVSALGKDFQSAYLARVDLAAKYKHLEKDIYNLFGKSKVGKEWNLFSKELPPGMIEAHFKNFAGHRLWEIKLQPGEKIYRIGDKNGFWWSREKPTSQLQAMVDNAILPEFNEFVEVWELTVSEHGLGTVYEGITGTQAGRLPKHIRDGTGGTIKLMKDEAKGASTIFSGGRGQIYIPDEMLKSDIFKNTKKELILDLKKAPKS